MEHFTWYAVLEDAKQNRLAQMRTWAPTSRGCAVMTFGELNSCELGVFSILMFLTPLAEVTP